VPTLTLFFANRANRTGAGARRNHSKAFHYKIKRPVWISLCNFIWYTHDAFAWNFLSLAIIRFVRTIRIFRAVLSSRCSRVSARLLRNRGASISHLTFRETWEDGYREEIIDFYFFFFLYRHRADYAIGAISLSLQADTLVPRFTPRPPIPSRKNVPPLQLLFSARNGGGKSRGMPASLYYARSIEGRNAIGAIRTVRTCAPLGNS
jgi:hypothetical protein